MTSSSATEPARRPCPDPDCVDEQGRPSIAEADTDGDTGYYACPACGYLFGWTQASPYPDGACPVGIPEAVRRAATPPKARLLPLTPIRRTT